MEWSILYDVTWTEMGGREWDRRGGYEVENPGDRVERLGERGVVGSLRCYRLFRFPFQGMKGSARRGRLVDSRSK